MWAKENIFHYKFKVCNSYIKRSCGAKICERGHEQEFGRHHNMSCVGEENLGHKILAGVAPPPPIPDLHLRTH